MRPIPTWFLEEYRSYCAAWRQPVAREQLESYYEALEPCAQWAITEASLELRRSRARDQFPPPASAWYETAQRLMRERRLREARPMAREEPWRVECDACDDTGWARLRCVGVGRRRDLVVSEFEGGFPVEGCGNKRPHAGHFFVRPCPCRATNRTFQRKHA